MPSDFTSTNLPPTLFIVLSNRAALSPQLPDDDGQGLWVGPLLAQPHTDGQSLRVQPSVQESAHLCQSAECFSSINNSTATVTAGSSCSVTHCRDTLGHNNI
eukprot:GFUD01041342.1.p1 GENE.GFUD01041342.1~~GFUD01041342.1.p1  ORF type:complete len:102 (-),score=12.09 GFUD01041342.1:37-342(-)